ncbi:MAG TPA: diguanylate cyclase [Baekduia sp.]|nr:diguanylate cyclase [Baekduia sp.]
MPEAVDLVAPDGVHIHANTASFEIFERVATNHEVSIPLRDLNWGMVDGDGNPLSFERHPVEITRLTGEEFTDVDVGFPTIDGGLVWMRTRTRRFGAHGPPHAVISTTIDVTAHLQAERGLRQAKELFAQAFASAPLGMALVDLDGRFLRVNPAICSLLGYTEQALLDLSIADITHPEDESRDELWRSTGTPANHHIEKRYLHADGSVIECVLSIATIKDEAGVPIHTIEQVQDVTEQRRLEHELLRLADRDHLTGLLNRRRFERELERQIERCARHGERAALLLLDIDCFKAVNDTGGHAAGDALLRHVGRILEDRIRRTDSTGRIGGDEFAAILLDANVEAAVRVAEELMAALRELDDVDATASVGIALLRPDDQVDAALARADRAMYAVKRAGRNGVLVEPR